MITVNVTIPETVINLSLTVDDTTYNVGLTTSNVVINMELTVGLPGPPGPQGEQGPPGESGGGNTQLVFLSTDVSKTNDGNFTDSGLTFIVPAGKHCYAKFFLIYFSGSSEDMQVRFTTDSALATNYFIKDISSEFAFPQLIDFPGSFFGPSYPTYQLSNSTSNGRGFVLDAVFIGGAEDANISVQYAQNSPGPNATGLKSGSFVQYTIEP